MERIFRYAGMSGTKCTACFAARDHGRDVWGEIDRHWNTSGPVGTEWLGILELLELKLDSKNPGRVLHEPLRWKWWKVRKSLQRMSRAVEGVGEAVRSIQKIQVEHQCCICN